VDEDAARLLASKAATNALRLASQLVHWDTQRAGNVDLHAAQKNPNKFRNIKPKKPSAHDMTDDELHVHRM
jgi:hypothetical protein